MSETVQPAGLVEPLVDDPREAVSTSIILPTYNEVRNIEPLVDEIRAVANDPIMASFSPIEIVFVDGGSTDGTRDKIEELVGKHPEVRAVYLKRVFGQTPALAAGFDHAAGEYIVPMDADGQNDPADVPLLLDTLRDGYDCVSGWRRDRKDPLSKRVPSRIQTALAKLTGPDINDFGCTLTAYRAAALEDITLYGEGHRYIPAKLHKLGYSVTEREVNHRPREHGESRYGLGRLVRGAVDLGFHVFWNRYSTRPLHFFGLAGFLLMAAGSSLGGHALLMRFAFGEALIPHLPRLVLITLLLVFGLQLFIFGVIVEILAKLYYQDEVEYRVDRTFREA